MSGRKNVWAQDLPQNVAQLRLSDIPQDKMNKFYDTLGESKKWRELGAKMGKAKNDLDEIQRQNRPTLTLIEGWKNSKNATVGALWKILKEINLLHEMSCLYGAFGRLMYFISNLIFQVDERDIISNRASKITELISNNNDLPEQQEKSYVNKKIDERRNSVLLIRGKFEQQMLPDHCQRHYQLTRFICEDIQSAFKEGVVCLKLGPYQEGINQLRRVATSRPAKVVSFFGKTHTGKSTLISEILKLLHPEAR